MPRQSNLTTQIHLFNRVFEEICPSLLLLSYQLAQKRSLLKLRYKGYTCLPDRLRHCSKAELSAYVDRLPTTSQQYTIFHSPLYECVFSSHQEMSEQKIREILKRARLMLSENRLDREFLRTQFFPIIHKARYQLEALLEPTLQETNESISYLQWIAKHCSFSFYLANLSLDIMAMPLIMRPLSFVGSYTPNVITDKMSYLSNVVYLSKKLNVDKKDIAGMLTISYFIYSLLTEEDIFSVLAYPTMSLLNTAVKSSVRNKNLATQMPLLLISGGFLYALLNAVIYRNQAPKIDAQVDLAILNSEKLTQRFYLLKAIEEFYNYTSVIYKRLFLTLFELPLQFILNKYSKPKVLIETHKGMMATLDLAILLAHRKLNAQCWFADFECLTSSCRELYLKSNYINWLLNELKMDQTFSSGEFNLHNLNDLQFTIKFLDVVGNRYSHDCKVDFCLDGPLRADLNGICQSTKIEAEVLTGKSALSVNHVFEQRFDIEYNGVYQYFFNEENCSALSNFVKTQVSSRNIGLTCLAFSVSLMLCAFYMTGLLSALFGIILINIFDIGPYFKAQECRFPERREASNLSNSSGLSRFFKSMINEENSDRRKYFTPNKLSAEKETSNLNGFAGLNLFFKPVLKEEDSRAAEFCCQSLAL